VKNIADPPLQEQGKVTEYFQSKSSFWNDIYASKGVYAEIHRDRHSAVLAWIDGLSLPPGTNVLEVGCGAGYMSVALAQKGFRVHAIDPSAAMVELARQHGEEAGVSEQLSSQVGDACALEFEDNSFDLVIAIGVIPWLDRPELAMQEMSRVSCPNGYVILTADNRSRLNVLLDPWMNPALKPLKQQVKKALQRTGLGKQLSKDIDSTLHRRRYIDAILMSNGLVKTRSMTVGFGPFSLFRHTIIPEPWGTSLHHRLQSLANKNTVGLRSSGSHYLVMAKKQETPLHAQATHAKKPVSDAT